MKLLYFKSLFGRHRVRATFYHIGAVVFLLTTLFYSLGIISVQTSYVITGALFIIDYIAEMFDPNPDYPGPWFERHFHRFLYGDKDDE